MIASLPMYDLVPLRGANDRLWQAIRRALGTGPRTLMRPCDLWDHWQSPDLLLSQTCGYPYRAHLHGKVTLVATPDYGLEGCGPGEYNSVFVARAGDPRDSLTDFAAARFAYNDPLSQSGWAAPMIHARVAGVWFGSFVQTGGHARSARAVAEGTADIAALDALTWKLLQAHDPVADLLKAIERTTPTPALPYITSLANSAQDIFAALETAIASLSHQDRALLSLKGVQRADPADYLAIPVSPPPPPGGILHCAAQAAVQGQGGVEGSQHSRCHSGKGVPARSPAPSSAAI